MSTILVVSCMTIGLLVSAIVIALGYFTDMVLKLVWYRYAEWRRHRSMMKRRIFLPRRYRRF